MSILTKEIIQQIVTDHTRLTTYLTSEDCESLANAINTFITEACGSGEAIAEIVTVGGYPDDSYHSVKMLCKYKDLKDGDKLYLRPQVSAVPDGWKLVPIEPTKEMIEGFWGEIKHGDEELAAAKEAYAAMLSTTPQASLNGLYENKCSCGVTFTGLKNQPFCVPCYDKKLRELSQVSAVPDGYAMVPIEPTKEMIAALKPVRVGTTTSLSNLYTELVLAAPQPAKAVSEPLGYTSKESIEIVKSGLGLGSFVDEKLTEFPIPIYVTPQPRITEQDAREIALSAFRYWVNNSNVTADLWLEDVGFALINKLNSKGE